MRTGPSEQEGTECVGLARGLHSWRFTCQRSDLPAMLECLNELASRPGAPFDRFDAAVVAHQLTEKLGGLGKDGQIGIAE
jgi:hypothetical protein